MRAGYKDIVGGGVVAFIGLVFLAGALKMRIGEATEMGPGYFPLLVSVIVILLGLGIAGMGLLRSGPIQKAEWQPTLAVLGGIGAFGLFLEQIGLLPATAACIAIASLGDPDSRPRETFLLATGTALTAWLIFRVGLGLQMPGVRWPSFLE